MEERTYRLASNPLIFMPGFVKNFIRRVTPDDFDAEKARELIRVGLAVELAPDAPGRVAMALAAGEYEESSSDPGTLLVTVKVEEPIRSSEEE